MKAAFQSPRAPDGPVVEMHAASFAERLGYTTGFERLDLRVDPGDLVLILLEQGRMEHPLADVLSGLEFADEGTVKVFGEDWSSLNADQQALMRWRIGRVFREHGWLSNLDVDENITLAERHHTKRSVEDIHREAEQLAGLIGLDALPENRPSAVDPVVLGQAQWVRAALGAPWLMLLESPGRVMEYGWHKQLLPLVRHMREQGTAVIWFCESEAEWQAESLNPSLKLRAIGNKLTDEGHS